MILSYIYVVTTSIQCCKSCRDKIAQYWFNIKFSNNKENLTVFAGSMFVKPISYSSAQRDLFVIETKISVPYLFIFFKHFYLD